MKHDDFFNYLTTEYNQPFSGWDFSYLNGRLEEIGSVGDTWDYSEKVRAEFSTVQSLLDMGTGGGEFLSSLQPLPLHTSATEGYPPNVPIARQRLEPLGVKVYDVSNDVQHLPFGDNQFDLVINRHEYYPPREVLRILKPGCRFITQQVGSGQDSELNTFLGAPPYPYAYWTLPYAGEELTAAGFHILEQRENLLVKRFYDVGAVVYYLKAIPWQVPEFSIEKYFDKLVEMQALIQSTGYFEVHDYRFLIVAEKA